MPFPLAAPVVSRRLHRLLLAALTTTAGPLLATVSLTSPAGATVADPPTNVPAPPGMLRACYTGGPDAACEAAALSAVNSARAAEGLGPLVLPTNYGLLTTAQQLLVLVDLERVDRGLVPAATLDPTLSASAASAAGRNADPTGPANTNWYSAWAGGEPDALATVFDWLYDDGPGSPNRACPPSCWGHRHALLAPFAAPSLGAAQVGSSWTALLVDQWASTGGFRWVDEAAAVRPAVPPAVTASAAPGTTAPVVVPVAASGWPLTVTATLSGDPAFALRTATCTAPAGGSCALVLSYSPGGAPTSGATLTVNGPGGPLRVAVSGMSGHGYWQATSNGAVYAFGGGGWLGDASRTPLRSPVVGMAATPTHGGYWLVASDGGIFSFGDAAYHGSTGATHLNAPIVGMAPTPDGGGYWLVASDGGIFSFGDAAYHGSTGATHLNKPIVGMAPTPDGGGYWLVASDGGIFSFGDAAYHGSTGATHLNAPIVGMAATPDGGGYWLAAADGGIFTFGDAAYHGSAGGLRLGAPVRALTVAPGGAGYWESAADGGVFAFAAPFLGSAVQLGPGAPVVAAAAS